MIDKPLHAVFSIATNGYEHQFRHCIQSHYNYCQRLRIPYFLIRGKPPWGISAHDSAWVKLKILDHLLQRFKGGVLYLDADCEVMDNCEDFRDWDKRCPDKALFAPLDYSNRLQACLIYCRCTSAGRRLVKKLSMSSFWPQSFIPRECKNLYENGHFIWICRGSPHVHVLPQEWNSGLYREVATPNVIHYGGDIMRDLQKDRLFSFQSRLSAALTGMRLPFHMIWIRHLLSKGPLQPIPIK